MADSCWCMAETNAILQSNYHPVKKKKWKESIRTLNNQLSFSTMVLSNSGRNCQELPVLRRFKEITTVHRLLAEIRTSFI